MTSEGRLGFFLPDFRGGGAERATIRVANELSARGWHVTLIVVWDRGSLREQLSSNVEVRALASGSLVRALVPLAKTLRSLNLPVVFSIMMQPSFLALLAGLAAPRTAIIPVEHSCFTSWRPQYGPVKFALYALLYRLLFGRARAIVSVGTEMADELARLVPTDAARRIAVIYNPIISSELDQLAEQATEYPVSDGRTAAFVGRLSPEKDLATLLLGFERLVRQDSAWRLWIVGDGPERGRMEHFVVKHRLERNVVFVGQTGNPFPYMRAADVLALTSTVEGFPTVLVEALYLGTPVVSSKCRTGPGEIVCEPEFGKLFEVGDHLGLADAIRHVASMPDASVARRAYGERFTVSASADSFEALIAKVLK